MDLFYRLLLFAYPRPFRREYGLAMLDLFRLQRNRARRETGHLGGAAFWAFAVDDLVRNAFAERTRRWQQRSPLHRRVRLSETPTPREPREMIDTMLRELRHAARRLIKAPVFSTTAIIIIALGIGANASMFTFVDAVLMRPQPFARPAELVDVYQDSDDGDPNSSSFPAYRDIAARTDVFSGATGIMPRSATLMNDDGVESVAVEYVTSNYFDVLGLPLTIGRAFSPLEDVDGGEPVAIVSYQTWRDRFGSDSEILGTTLRLEGAAITIVGVGPQSYGGIMPGFSRDLWLSLSAMRSTMGEYAATTLDRRGDHWFLIKARLAAGVSAVQAQAGMDALATRLATEFPEMNTGRDITVFGAGAVRLHPSFDSSLLPLSAGLMTLVGLVLVIACSNLANLLLVRASTRGREVSVRLAVGASRGRIILHMMSESVVLSLAGGALGLLLAGWTIRAFTAAQLPLGMPAPVDLRLDMRVVSFTLVVSLLYRRPLRAAPGIALGTGQRGRLVARRRHAAFVPRRAFHRSQPPDRRPGRRIVRHPGSRRPARSQRRQRGVGGCGLRCQSRACRVAFHRLRARRL